MARGGGYKLWAETDRDEDDRILRSLKWQRKRLLSDMARYAAAAQDRIKPDAEREKYCASAARMHDEELPRLNREIAEQTAAIEARHRFEMEQPA